MSWFSDITLDGRAAFLCLLEPNWRVRPKIAHAFATESNEGGTGIEALASEHHDVRLTQTCFFTLGEAAAQELLVRLLSLSDERIALPLWPDVRSAADYAAGTRIYTAQHTVNFNRATGAHVVDGSGGHAETAGLLVGCLASEPTIVARTDLDCTIEVTIEDDSPWGCRVGVNAVAVAEWLLQPNWATLPDIARSTKHERQRIGQGRETAFLHAEAPAKRIDRATFRLQSVADIRCLLSFWVARRGPHQAFAVPAWFHPGYEEAPSLNKRFADEVLTLEYITDQDARCRIGFRAQLQLAEGQPSQARPSRAHLIKVWWDGSATLQVWTDWASPLVNSGLTYLPAIAEVKSSAENLRPGDGEWELLVCDFAGNPLRAFALLAIERRLKIEIRECDPANAAAAALVFVGEIKTAPRKGRLYTAKCSLFGGVLRNLVPNAFCQPSCNNTLYDELCGVSEEANKVTGAVSAVNGVGLDVSGGGDKAADWFAYGYAAFAAGENIELRFIVRSAPIAGGTRLTVHRPLFLNGVSAAVEFFPGCDSQFDGGCVKFGNQENFFGAPHKPDFIDSIETGFKAKTGK